MNYFKDPRSPIRSRALPGLATLAVGLLIAGCGSSGGSGGSTITIGNESAADNALLKTAEAKVVKTPSSGPLASEPKVTPPTGAAPTKLESKDLITGTGAEAKPGDSVTVNYVGVLYKGGKQFDASWIRKEPFTFILGQKQVIAGWDQGVLGMKVGGRRELVIPSSLGYGAAGSPPKIPANAPLVFVIDLLGT